MSSDNPRVPNLNRCWIEGAFTGLAYACTLAALGVFVVGSFRPQYLPMPYWMDLRWLRTDTFGFGCFVVATFSICVSEYFRLSRIALTRHHDAVTEPPSRTLHQFALAAARALAFASSTLVVYLSINSVTHPQTLLIQATHFLSWPTEGTLRVVALIATACAVAVARTLRIATGSPCRSAN
jgi:hypothetical protein